MKVSYKNETNYTGDQKLVQAIQENTGLIFFHILSAKRSLAPNDTLEALEGR